MTLSLCLLTGVTAVGAPSASAVGSSACRYPVGGLKGDVAFNGVNYRTGPGTRYASKAQLYKGDDLRPTCSRGDWLYAKLTRRSKGGLPAGTRGWVRIDMLKLIVG
ncbi:hypothetical protein [Streptomyces sp. NPDC055287]